MRNIELSTGGFYHIYNRGVDKRLIFNDQDDFLMFYRYLYLFSDYNYKNRFGRPMMNEIELAGAEQLSMLRKPLIKILSFNLVGNHFHLFAEQFIDDGISIFLHKIKKTYSNKFNKKHSRVGGLFESVFKAKLIDNESHLMHIPRYIHLNSLDLEMPEWRHGKIKDWDKALRILNSDPWSSHRVYMGEKQLLPIVDEEFARTSFIGTEDYVNYLKEWATSDDGMLEERDYWNTELEI